MLLEPLNRCLECTFFAGFDFWIAHIPTNRKAMSATFKVLSLVTRRKLAENLVCFSLRLMRELLVFGAAIDQKRCFGIGDIFLQRFRITLKHSSSSFLPQGLQEPST